MRRALSAAMLLAAMAALSTSLMRIGNTRWPFFWRRTAPPSVTTTGEPPPPQRRGLYTEDERGAPFYGAGRPWLVSLFVLALLALLVAVILMAVAS